MENNTNNWENNSQFYTNYEEPKKPEGRKKKSFGGKLARCASYALVFGLVSGSVFTGSSYLLGNAVGTSKQTQTDTAVLTTSADTTQDAVKATATSDTSSVEATDVSGVVANVMPSIVAITNMSEVQYQSMFGQTGTYESESCGSGIIVSQDDDSLYMVTNNHVVQGANSLTVQFSDDSTATATVTGTDETNDLAVVQVPIDSIEADTLSQIKVATLGDSDSISVGAQAIAIGNALGYGQSVTTGVISALNREVSVSDETTGASSTNELIQTDAAINPGNSGGALIDTNGAVIGINSSKYSDTSVEGMGFAIPINTASPIITDIINGTAKSTNAGTAYLGVYGVDVNENVAKTYNMPQGVYIAEIVSGSAAENAGLTKGMIITSFNGKSLTTMSELESQIAACAAGDTVTLTIQTQQNGQYTESSVDVTLGTKSN